MPVHSPLLKQSQLLDVPPLSDMLKFGGSLHVSQVTLSRREVPLKFASTAAILEPSAQSIGRPSSDPTEPTPLAGLCVFTNPTQGEAQTRERARSHTQGCRLCLNSRMYQPNCQGNHRQQWRGGGWKALGQPHTHRLPPPLHRDHRTVESSAATPE